MRIIAGTNKGRKLECLPGRKVRPTSGKVREAIFGICGKRLSNATVADLFAGTGAFGLEALSRGAAHCVFVDSDPGALKIIKKNIAACRASDQATVLCRDILRNPDALVQTGLVFDLVFMDPPYNLGAVGPALKSLEAKGVLSKEALVIIEHAATDPLQDDHPDFRCVDQRKYGKTIVSFLINMLANGQTVSSRDQIK
jgi:16S rRNA (guanine966-N2)-methyltransferase